MENASHTTRTRTLRSRNRGIAFGLLGCALLTAASVASPAAAADTPQSPTPVPTLVYATSVGADAADVYYPENGDRLPVVLLQQGANVDKSHYEGYARTVAAFGFVVVVPNHVRSVFGIPGLWASADQGLTTVAWSKTENTRTGSPLANRLDPASFALLGHSFGGAAGVATVQGQCAAPFCFGLPPGAVKPAELKAAAFFGTNNVPPGGGPVAPVNNTVPVALIQGSADGVAAPAAAQATYDALTGTPKALVTVAGVNHYGITGVQNPPGAAPDPSPQTTDQVEGIRTSARWSALFLKAALGDAFARSYVHFWGDGADPAVTVQQVSQRS
ncbi:alpha/beta hydrolase [Streptomyces sp. NPDC006464]|uniref:alpha/beta hydrolase n=1 Tax=Streptomyces sp. NPDC006464 TaxID=3154305 RepID=UPI0033B2078A